MILENRQIQERIDAHAEYLAQLIMDDKQIQELCHRLASELSGTDEWTKEEFEMNEPTVQYDFYWSEYVRWQALIVNKALTKVLGKFIVGSPHKPKI